NRFGQQIFSSITPGGASGILTAAAVGQFDGKPGLELASLSNSVVAPTKPFIVRVFQLPPSTLVPPWPMLRRTPTSLAVQPSVPFLVNYVRSAYQAFLGRQPNAVELVQNATALRDNRLTPLQLARFLAQSNAYRGSVVDDAYRRFLGRAPLPTERLNWVNQ